MGKKYYCDYCDKAFADNQVNRRNHMNGVVHKQMRDLHYQSFADPAIILAQESAKKPCSKFRSGNCEFGTNCRFSHMTEEERSHLRMQVEISQTATRQRHQKRKIEPPDIEEWLEKRTKKEKKTESTSTEFAKPSVPRLPKYELPSFLQGISNLPPSVLPPSQDCLQGLETDGWG